MCGRYAITLPPEAYRALFGYPEQPNFPPRYNVAPTQPVPVVLQERGERHFRLVRWGFLPSWAKDPKDFPLVINARGETLETKPTFKAALKRRRCIFLADGFYEWQRHGREKAPFLIRLRDRGPMPLAGLWETYTDPAGGEIDTAAIVTTDANGVLAAIHDRMPVILSREDIPAWLDVSDEDTAKAMRLVRPCPEAWVDMVPVSRRVNKVENDDPGVQEPLPAPEPAPATARRKAAKPRSSDEDEQGSLF
ncbi:SOS response-associated peptidase [Microvirga thermotolerans]|uniref:Abasic site processing protein n=1 Tax=Microvirga thermotolerans TaxID=2651334 RepID=A0A5P9JW33_9HYPH|nr:SOS response-associated peptidase [Microvirga thermotolerans]QFU15856.1 SOS response-associated peptidase [Microvirga thermotolerans]